MPFGSFNNHHSCVLTLEIEGTCFCSSPQAKLACVPFLIYADVLELLNFPEFSYLSPKSNDTCFPWRQQGWPRLKYAWQMLRPLSGPMLFRTRESSIYAPSQRDETGSLPSSISTLCTLKFRVLDKHKSIFSIFFFKIRKTNQFKCQPDCPSDLLLNLGSLRINPSAQMLLCSSKSIPGQATTLQFNQRLRRT